MNSLKDGLWIDARNNETCNLREKGIIDPTNVLISAITNSFSIAGSVLTTECAIVSVDESSQNEDINE